MRQLPVFVTVQDRPVLLVGGGELAVRKLRLIRSAGGVVSVVAPAVCDEIKALADQGDVTWTPRAFKAGDVQGKALVYGATDKDRVDTVVSRIARDAGVPVNIVDRPELSDFTTPAIIDRDPITIGISSAGVAPVLARTVKAMIERTLHPNLGRLGHFAESFRGAVKAMVPTGRGRLRFWDAFFQGPIAAKVLAGDEVGAREDMLAQVNRPSDDDAVPGIVHIVGAGPGDADLLTLRAQRLLQQADVIVYDKLVTAEVMDLARRDAERIFVGKSRANHTVPQEEIGQILIREAKAGNRVVRLKGGDPFVFGRGGEELEDLQAAGVTAEVVPGVTAAIGAAAGTGIPLTHRAHASAVTFMTAEGSAGEPDLDWQALATGKHTLAVYMGVKAAGRTATRLMDKGLDAATPVAVIENGARPGQKLVPTTLGSLSHDILAQGIKGPAMILIGDVTSRVQENREIGADTATVAV